MSAAGVLLPEGAADPHYTLIGAPGGSGYGPTTFVAVTDGYPLPPWIPQGPASQWIEPVSGMTDDHVVGNYVYRTTFDLTGFIPSTASVTMRVASDDILLDVLLNGTSTGFTHASFVSFSPFVTLTSGFVDGVNTLDFIVQNGPFPVPNPTGLRVELSGTANPTGGPPPPTGDIPEPSTWILCGLGLAGLLGYRWGLHKRMSSNVLV